jgi:hypothetical protein
MSNIHKNDSVTWEWGNGTAKGKVESVSTEKTSIQSEGSHITRNASKDNPAIVIVQSDGTKVLKSARELKK